MPIYPSNAYPMQLGGNTIPVGIAPTGTMANNGAVTLGTAHTGTYSGGIYLYFPANAIQAGSAAGFYWTVMSSSTVGQVFNNTYTPGSAPTKPAVPVALSSTGPGAYTGATTEITVLSFTLPGGSLGNYGRLVSTYIGSGNSTAGVKTIKFKFGATSMFLAGLATQSNVEVPRFVFANRGSQALNFSSNTAFGGTLTTAPWFFTTIDTSVDVTVTVTLQIATATDYAIMEFSTFELTPGY